MKDTNKFVNNKDFGVIARSSRGSNTPEQVGNQNQLEYGRAPKLRGQTLGKQTKAEVQKGAQSGVRHMQRAGGSKNPSNRELYEKNHRK